MKQYKVGIVGATGMVGQRFTLLLENHPWFDVRKARVPGLLQQLRSPRYPGRSDDHPGDQR